MITCASLHTFEIDNPEMALSEINTQLSGKIALKSNTVGIIMCHAEFVGSGVFEYVSKNLPFDVVGVTSSIQGVNDVIHDMIFTLFVITSDDVEFITGHAPVPNVKDADKCLKEAVKNINKPGIPSFILTFPSLNPNYPGDYIVDTWNDMFPGVSVAGSMPSTDDFALTGLTCYNGQVAKDTSVFIMFYGDVNPRFVMATISEDSKYPIIGEVTRAEENRVYEINGKEAWQYMRNAGVVDENAEIIGLPVSVPLLIRNPGEDVPVLRGIGEMNKEFISIFARKLKKGTLLNMINMSPEDTLLTTKEAMVEISDMPNVNGVLILSCIMRYGILLSGDSSGELKIISENLKDIPFMAGYAGGELCPVKDGDYVNRYHNYSLVAVIL